MWQNYRGFFNKWEYSLNHNFYGTLINPTWDTHNGHNHVFSAAVDFAY